MKRKRDQLAKLERALQRIFDAADANISGLGCHSLCRVVADVREEIKREEEG